MNSAKSPSPESPAPRSGKATTNNIIITNTTPKGSRMGYKHWLVSLAIIVAVAATWFWLRPTEQQRIRTQFLSLAEAISKNPQEGNAAHAMKMLALGNLLAENVSVDLREFPYNGDNSAETIVSLATRGRSLFDVISIDIIEVETTLEQPDQATSRCVLKATLQSTSYNDNTVRHVLTRLRKVDNQWRFASVQEDDLLQK